MTLPGWMRILTDLFLNRLMQQKQRFSLRVLRMERIKNERKQLLIEKRESRLKSFRHVQRRN